MSYFSKFIILAWPGKIYINGGTLKSNAGGIAGAICIRSGECNISGGEFIGPYGIDVENADSPSNGIVTFTDGLMLSIRL